MSLIPVIIRKLVGAFAHQAVTNRPKPFDSKGNTHCFVSVREIYMIEGNDYHRWDAYLRDFNRRNRWRPTRLMMFGEAGMQDTERASPLVGISLEAGTEDYPRLHIMLGDRNANHQPHQTHTITGVKRVTPRRGTDGRDESLEIEDEHGEKNLLRF